MNIFRSPSRFPLLPELVSAALPKKPRPKSAPTKVSALLHIEQDVKALQQILLKTLTQSEDASASEMWCKNIRDELIVNIQDLEEEFDEAELTQLMLRRNYEDKLFQIERAKEKHEDFKREVKDVQSHFTRVVQSMTLDSRKIEKEMRSWRRKVSVVEDDLTNRLRRSRMLEASVLKQELIISEKNIKRHSVVLCQEELAREMKKLREKAANHNPRMKKLQSTLLNATRRLSEINLESASPRKRNDSWQMNTMSPFTMKHWDTLTLPETLDTVSALATAVDTTQFQIPIDLLRRQHSDLMHENSRLKVVLETLNMQIEEIAKSQEMYIADNMLLLESAPATKYS